MSVKLRPQFVINEKGEKCSVLLSIEEYNAVLQELEDYADASKVHQMMETSTAEDFEDWTTVKARLRALDDS